jgi:hypothetical protein
MLMEANLHLGGVPVGVRQPDIVLPSGYRTLYWGKLGAFWGGL